MKLYLDLIIGSVLIVYYVIVNILSNRTISFSRVIGIIGIIFVAYHFFKIRFKDNKYFKKANRILLRLIFIGIVFLLVLEVMIVSYPKKNEDNAEYMIILGAGLNNGGQLSLTLKDRLDAALKCINQYNNDSFIVVSGGKGTDENISEAEAMKRYLIQSGVAEDKIIKEDKSRNTYENFKFSRKKIEEYSDKSIDKVNIKVITTDFHSLRSSLLAKRNGYENIKVYSSKTISYLVPAFYIREALAIVKSFIFDR